MKLTERGGFEGDDGSDKSALTHIRFWLYQEWRTVFELLLVHWELAYGGESSGKQDEGHVGGTMYQDSDRGGYINDPQLGMLDIVPVPQDGSCFFHALVAHGLGTDAATLRRSLLGKIVDGSVRARIRSQLYVDTVDLEHVANAMGRRIVLYEGYYNSQRYHEVSFYGDPDATPVYLLLRSVQGQLEGHYDALRRHHHEKKE